MQQNHFVVGQSGGPTCAINATLAGILREAALRYPQSRIYGMGYGVAGFLEDRVTDLTELARQEERLELLRRTPGAALGSCRRRLPADPEDPEFDALFRRMKQYGIGTFFYIGGNDSMDTVAKLSPRAEREGVRVIGVPKTIDNDLVCTDHTPGYGSAAKYVATVMEEIARDCRVYLTRAVTVVEVMGRDSGWLTAAAGLPALSGQKTADLIYLPETPFSLDGFLGDVEDLLRVQPEAVVAVSEGIRLSDGSYVGSDGRQKLDAFGHVRLTGAGNVLTDLLSRRLGCKTRGIELNLPQRCASHSASAVDLDEAEQIGRAAVAACEDAHGKMMIFRRVCDDPYRIEIGTAAAAEVANRVRVVPEEWLSPAGRVSPALLRFISPLIQGEVALPRKNGLPVHFSLDS